jgi:NAD(P)-dependent dehydrogenase (short-subunit alcohol dehydrogenase family)
MKTAIVTGGDQGIGSGSVQTLLQDGCAVIVFDVHHRRWVGSSSSAQNVETFLCDVGRPEEVRIAMQKVEERYGKIDFLVNNAGVGVFEPIERMSIEDWNRVLSVNLSSVFYTVKYGKHLFTDPSAIVNIASTRALMSEPHGEAYGASKGGIVALSHALAVSLGPKTRVNCVSPGWIEVNGYDRLSDLDHAQHPAGKVGKTEDVAEAVWFLLSDKSSFVTGQNVVVDGGMTRKMIYR